MKSSTSDTLKRFFLSLPTKGIFHGVRSLGKLPKKFYWYLRFKGDFEVPVDDKHSFRIHHHGFSVENSIFWAGLTGEWEAVSLKLWIRLVKNADVILDIGANTGVYSLVAKSLNPASKVYAFEPISRIYEKLAYNNKLNNYDIVCLDVAASNVNGSATIYDYEGDNAYSATINKEFNPSNIESVPTQIKTIRMDTFIEQHNIPKVDLIKLDVETFEAEVIEGMGIYLEKFRPVFLVEILNDSIGEKVEDLVKDLGYLYFNIDEVKGTIKQEQHIRKSDDYNYLLCSRELASQLQLPVKSR